MNMNTRNNVNESTFCKKNNKKRNVEVLYKQGRCVREERQVKKRRQQERKRKKKKKKMTTLPYRFLGF